MGDFRSRSYGGAGGDGRMQIENYSNDPTTTGPSSYGINGMQDLRCYSANYAAASVNVPPLNNNNDFKLKKGKSTSGSTSKSWSFNDPELQRKKRVASYKVYTVEGKVKGSFKKSFRWIKDRCSRMVHGWW